MKVTIDIPDSIYENLQKENANIEKSIIEAVEEYTARKLVIENDPFTKWIQEPVTDKDGKDDVAQNHDKYLYGSN